MNGEVDEKTKGPFLIKLCMNLACMPVIASDPILPSLEVSTLFVKELRILKFERQTPIASDNNIESSWIINSERCIPSLSYIGNAVRFDNFCNDI